MKFQYLFYIALCVVVAISCVQAEPEPEPEPEPQWITAIISGVKHLVGMGVKQAVKTSAKTFGKAALKVGTGILKDEAKELPKYIGDAIHNKQQ